MAVKKVEKTREQREKAEYNRTKRIVAGLDKNLVKLLDPLIKNAAFLAIQLEEYREIISKDGGVSKYKNGANQWGTKKSPEAELYNTMLKNYKEVIRQLFDLSPESEGDASAIAIYLKNAAARRARP